MRNKNKLSIDADYVPGFAALYDIASGECRFISKKIKNILGYEQIQFSEGGLPFAMSLIHPDDLAIFCEVYRQLFRLQAAADLLIC